MEGPKVPSEAWRREEGGVWGGAPYPLPSMGVWGLCPQKNFQKINLEIAYFSAFLQAEMVSSLVVARQD